MEIRPDETQPELSQLLFLGEFDHGAAGAAREADLLPFERPRLVVELEGGALGSSGLQGGARGAQRGAQTAADRTAATEAEGRGGRGQVREREKVNGCLVTAFLENWSNIKLVLQTEN